MEWIFPMIVFCMNYNIQLPLRASRRFFELAKGCLPQRKFELISFGIFGYNGRRFQLEDFQLWWFDLVSAFGMKRCLGFSFLSFGLCVEIPASCQTACSLFAQTEKKELRFLNFGLCF